MLPLYTLLIYLCVPFALLRLWWRGRAAPAYRQHWAERLGFYGGQHPLSSSVWLHAVSVGETVAAIPLVKALLAQGHVVVLTNMTITGRQRAQAVFGTQVINYYLPYDLPGAVQRFYRQIQPRLGIIMETEIWPNLYAVAAKNHIPLILANARLAEKSAKYYSYCTAIFHPTLRYLTHIAAQGAKDAERFVQLGVDSTRVSVMGNIKFVLEVPPLIRDAGQQLRHAMQGRPVWIAASTHSGEEVQILQALRYVQQKIPNVLLILVPRHPERFNQVAELLVREQLTFTRRSQADTTALAHAAVLLGDTMGELLVFYAAADVAFVGGSLVSVGGHNVLEPAALALPIVTGPYTYNFADIMQLLQQAQACLSVQSATQLGNVVADLLIDPPQRQRLGQAAYAVMRANGDALDKLVNMLAPYL